jgi:hypothetical protein
MIAKGCSLRNQGDIASTGRNPGLEGQDIRGFLAQQLYAKTLPKLPLESVVNSMLAHHLW